MSRSLFDDDSVQVQNAQSEHIPKASVIRIPPFSYIHVLDTNQNVTHLEVGPKSLTCLDHEKVVFGPAKMIIVPPGQYCVIHNPVVFADTENNNAVNNIAVREVVKDKYGQAKLRHGEQEIRFSQVDPFALYPGESLVGGIQQLKVVAPDSALRLRALRNFADKHSLDTKNRPVQRNAGDEWLFEGPGTYLPQVEVEVVETIHANVLGADQALHLKARKDCIDRNGNARKAGEEWLVQTEGAYLPGVDEVVMKTLNAHILEKDKTALHLRALKTFTDTTGKERKAGDEWLVTYEQHESHVPDVYEQVVGEVRSITLTNRQFVVIVDPVDENDKPQLGQRKLVKGERCFFLQPGERLEAGIQNVYILAPEEALLVRAKEGFEEQLTVGKQNRRVRRTPRNPGDRWYIYGPGEYFPPVQVQVQERRKAIVQIEGLGIYMFYSMFSLIFFLVLLFFVSLFSSRIASALF